jgi:hypothetical protein
MSRMVSAIIFFLIMSLSISALIHTVRSAGTIRAGSTRRPMSRRLSIELAVNESWRSIAIQDKLPNGGSCEGYCQGGNRDRNRKQASSSSLLQKRSSSHKEEEEEEEEEEEYEEEHTSGSKYGKGDEGEAKTDEDHREGEDDGHYRDNESYEGYNDGKKERPDTEEEDTAAWSSSTYNAESARTASSSTPVSSAGTSHTSSSSTWLSASSSSLSFPSSASFFGTAPPVPVILPTPTPEPNLAPQRVSLLTSQVVKAKQRAIEAFQSGALSGDTSVASTTWSSPRPGDAFTVGDRISLLWNSLAPSLPAFQLRLCILRAAKDLQDAHSSLFGDGACGAPIIVNGSASSSVNGWQVSL